MVFSRATEYAIRALSFLASQPAGKLAGAREISEAEEIPMPFLWKILQLLARRGLIHSFKGLRGGYELSRPAEQISVSDIVLVTDGNELATRCVLGLPACGDQNACSLHRHWKRIRRDILGMLEGTTLADLARSAPASAIQRRSRSLPRSRRTMPRKSSQGV